MMTSIVNSLKLPPAREKFIFVWQSMNQITYTLMDDDKLLMCTFAMPMQHDGGEK
jgi:hypothetical protein